MIESSGDEDMEKRVEKRMEILKKARRVKAQKRETAKVVATVLQTSGVHFLNFGPFLFLLIFLELQVLEDRNLVQMYRHPSISCI